jgi:hypothetical protein
MSDAIIGSVAVAITPDARGFIDKLTSQIIPPATAVGDQFGVKFGDSAVKAITDRLAAGLRGALGSGDPTRQGNKTGQSYADAFSATVKARLDAAARSLGPRVTVDADTNPALAQMEALRKEIRTTEANVRIGRIDDTVAVAQIDALKLKLDRLGASTESVRIKVDTAAAVAELASLQAALKTTDDDVQSVGKSADNAKQKLSLMSGALILSPALVPLAGGIAGITAGLTGLGGAGILAFKGIDSAMKSGGTTANAYRGILDGLKASVAPLERIAAIDVLPGVRQGAAELVAELPKLNPLVAGLSKDLGSITSHGIDAVIGGFHVFSPLIQQAAGYVTNLVTKFDGWVNGPGGTAFAQTLSKDFNQVVPALEHVVAGLAKLAEAAAPIGSVIVAGINALGVGLHAIPLPILTGAVAAFVAFKAAGLGLAAVAASVKAVSAAMVVAGASENVMTLGLTGLVAVEGEATIGLSALAGPIGLVVGGITALTFGLIGHKKAQIDDTGAVQAWTSALVASNGAINDQVKSSVAKSLSDNKTLDQAKKYGVAVQTVTSGVLGSIPAQKSWKTSLDAAANSVQYQNKVVNGVITGMYVYTATGKQATTAQYNFAQGAKNLEKSLGSQAKQFGNSAAAQKNQAAAAKVLGSQAELTSSQIAGMTANLGLTTQTGQQYLAMAGLFRNADGNIVASTKQISDALQVVGRSYEGATQTGNDFLNAVSAFSQGSATTGMATAAEQAALIGATLKAANGDALNYASSINATAVAQNQLTTSLASAAQQTGSSGESLQAYVASVVDLKKGTIDYSNAAAAPLISSLQSIQTAAMNAASATFQHNLATETNTKAADDAYAVYKSKTLGMFIDSSGKLTAQAQQLGLNAQQAQALSAQYFGMPKQVKTLIEQEGADPVLTVLKKIETDMEYLAGLRPKPIVGVVDHASGPTDAVNKKLLQINGQTARATVIADTEQASANLAALQNQLAALGAANAAGVNVSVNHGQRGTGAATGGFIYGPGTATSDSIPARLSNGEFVVRATQAAKYGPLLDSINKGVKGFAAGGPVNTALPATLTINTDNKKAFDSLIAQVRAAIPSARAAVADLSKAFNDAMNLQGIDKKLAGVKTSLTAAEAALSSYRQKYTDIASSVVSGLQNQQSLATIGQDKTTGYTAGVGNIIAGLQSAGNTTSKFNSEINKLIKEGVNKSYVEQLAEAGPSSTLDALSRASAAQLGLVNRQVANLQGAQNKAGALVAQYEVGPQIAAAEKQTTSLIAEQRTLTKQTAATLKIMTKFLQAASDLADRPIVLEADGTQIARVVEKAQSKAKRR